MITEHALLHVIPGQEMDFERAFSQAKPIIASMPGFRKLSLSRSLESPGTYLLLVEWDRLEDHTVGFRQSTQYENWRALLHHFYDPFPVVEHYTKVL
ncbi:antibiotic biosynthesis monooxygenase [Arthrobacter sp. B10-11]|uniref:antibiotic biosynthesis monooxygenase family protein n=1 Tax=Arthrobacter sp. B10-11 TaxID=3081160 RepID=UPI002952F021|nr:antibiotic biosynthesis monooxygenase [Arthrobacter sp. B10-11]MDV8148063.1 antibiotic biosynthesis monooxygenase [Arthrobacter sp. B10-11]